MKRSIKRPIYNPNGYTGRLDKYLPRMTQELAVILQDEQEETSHRLRKMSGNEIKTVAAILVDFAADLHCGTGIWNEYESYNRELFGAPLPLSSGKTADGISEERIGHLLWIVFEQLVPDLVLSPQHKDLSRLASVSSGFLKSGFSDLPRESGVKAFLGTPNDFGWDVKRKLIWLGRCSYMFRVAYEKYVEDKGDPKQSVSTTDDFICQECTRWSGLGVIDILAALLAISDDQKGELRSWYERHTGLYRVITSERDVLEVENLASGHTYRIRIQMDNHPFTKDLVVFGSLTPWKGEWYWSGRQRLLTGIKQAGIDEMIVTMKRASSSILCRYWKEYADLVRERASSHSARMLEFHGTDLIIYQDGLSAAADWERETAKAWSSLAESDAKEIMHRWNLSRKKADIRIPKDVLNHENGVGVFINPKEGMEIMLEFNPLVTGMKKAGIDLTEEESQAIHSFLTSQQISPAFVFRIVREYGIESIKTVFLLSKCKDDYWLDYLLRSLKGQFYRKRYPSLSVL
jgi:hypothetical protein